MDEITLDTIHPCQMSATSNSSSKVDLSALELEPGYTNTSLEKEEEDSKKISNATKPENSGSRLVRGVKRAIKHASMQASLLRDKASKAVSDAYMRMIEERTEDSLVIEAEHNNGLPLSVFLSLGLSLVLLLILVIVYFLFIN